jgi:hypothetical protein
VDKRQCNDNNQTVGQRAEARPVDRAIAACLAAIEIQNKPMQARVIKESGGDVRAIEVWEPGTRRRLRSRQARPPQQGWAWYVGL